MMGNTGYSHERKPTAGGYNHDEFFTLQGQKMQSIPSVQKEQPSALCDIENVANTLKSLENDFRRQIAISEPYNQTLDKVVTLF